MMPNTETSGDNVAEEWSTPVYWEKDPAIKAKWRRQQYQFLNKGHKQIQLTLKKIKQTLYKKCTIT